MPKALLWSITSQIDVPKDALIRHEAFVWFDASICASFRHHALHLLALVLYHITVICGKHDHSILISQSQGWEDIASRQAPTVKGFFALQHWYRPWCWLQGLHSVCGDCVRCIRDLYLGSFRVSRNWGHIDTQHCLALHQEAKVNKKSDIVIGYNCQICFVQSADCTFGCYQCQPKHSL